MDTPIYLCKVGHIHRLLIYVIDMRDNPIISYEYIGIKVSDITAILLSV